MADNKFQVAISAQDETSRTLLEISRNLRTLTAGMKAVNVEQARIEHHSVWTSLHERLDGVNERAALLGEHLEGVHGRLSGILPQLAALGEIGASGGMFKLTDEVAERILRFKHDAEKLGFGEDPGQLARLRLSAKLTDTNVEALESAFRRLQPQIERAGLGKNKELARVFTALGISVYDANHHLKTTAQLFPEIQLAFRNNPAHAGYLANLLFGKGGAELIPLLKTSREELHEMFGEFDKINYIVDPGQKLDLEKYHQSWILMGFAVDQFSKQIGVELAPVLRPVVDLFREFLTENRADIAHGIAEGLGRMAKNLQAVDWKGTFHDVEEVGHVLKELYDTIGGFKTIFEIFLAYKSVKLFGSLIEGAGQAVTAIKAVDAALSGSILFRLLGPTAAGIYFSLPKSTQTEEQEQEGLRKLREEAAAGRRDRGPIVPLPSSESLGRQFARPENPATFGLPAVEAPRGVAPDPDFLPRVPYDPKFREPMELKLQLTIDGLPDGIGVTATGESRLHNLQLEVNTGRAFAPMPGAP